LIVNMISAPAQSDYFLFIAEDGSKPNRWNWEIRRKSKPMGAKVSETGFQSRQAAEFSGGRALSGFLIELRGKRRDYTTHAKNSPHEVVWRDVRYWHKADIASALHMSAFGGKADMRWTA
jgi:hypothetical protein